MQTTAFYTIQGSGGLQAEVSNPGAKITKLLVVNRQGEVYRQQTRYQFS
jgi:hypothetical protein